MFTAPALKVLPEPKAELVAQAREIHSRGISLGNGKILIQLPTGKYTQVAKPPRYWGQIAVVMNAIKSACSQQAQSQQPQISVLA